MAFDRVPYEKLNSRQKENYNFAKVSARLADYGYNCLRLSDDWQGADFIACHIDNETFLKVQLKGRLTLDRKYIGKGIRIAFLLGDEYYLYPHDELLKYMTDKRMVGLRNRSWLENGLLSWGVPPRWALEWLAGHKIGERNNETDD